MALRAIFLKTRFLSHFSRRGVRWDKHVFKKKGAPKGPLLIKFFWDGKEGIKLKGIEPNLSL